MNIGSVLSGYDRFAGFSAVREGSSSAQQAAAASAAQNVNDPSRVVGSWNAEDSKGASGDKSGSKKGRFDKNECQTCKNRTYQDGSDDPGVSFKNPTKISPEQAATAVMGHEMEHVTRNQAEAKAEGREVISQSVKLQSAVCAECGKPYIAGGETTTVTGERKKNDAREKFQVGLSTPQNQKGKALDAVA